MRTPIDAFVLDGLRKRGLTPSPPADRLTLLRRVTFDLTGLPPSPADIDRFLSDRSPDAYERIVTRLLSSRALGERWAQHWLDVVRFGETNGYELDADRPQAWRYRDWVIRALNSDMPYDRFLQAQVAGDQIAPNDFDMRVATGFLRAGPQHVVSGNQDDAVNRQEWLTEATTGIGSAILGLTIQCARCHDHKYDPIPQAEYYRLQAFFAGSDNYEFDSTSPDQKKSYAAARNALAARIKPLVAQAAEIEAPYRKRLRDQKEARLTAEQREALATDSAKRTSRQQQLVEEAGIIRQIVWDELLAALSPSDRARRAEIRGRIHRIEQEAPEPPPAAPGVAEVRSPPPATLVLQRGDPHGTGPEIGPGFPAALAPITASGHTLGQIGATPAADNGVRHAAAAEDTASSVGAQRRLALAKWLTQPDNPLTARVMVNRVWQGLFGRGIVATPNDFGRNGQPPTNPALLDWLAATFAGGTSDQRKTAEGATTNCSWSVKRLIKLIVTSSVYRQSSAYEPARARIDPENRSLWRMNRRRLDAEALRDDILAVSGVLNRQSGGPSVLAPLEPEVVATIFTEGEPDNIWPVTPDPRQHVRRSIYLLRKRNVKVPMLALFDQPDMMSSCGARLQSVHALQALTLLNSAFITEQSQALAARVWRDAPGNDESRIRRLYLLCFGREPLPREGDTTGRFLRGQRALLQSRMRGDETLRRPDGFPRPTSTAEVLAWTDLCLATLNLNEFAYVR